jgi:hypothetical protein
MVDQDNTMDNTEKLKNEIPDENGNLFLFANLKIIDKDTGEVLVNKPC